MVYGKHGVWNIEDFQNIVLSFKGRGGCYGFYFELWYMEYEALSMDYFKTFYCHSKGRLVIVRG